MGGQNLTPQEAARRAADPDYLLPGEQRDVRCGCDADAVHWASVYRELLVFKEQLLSLARSQIGTMSEDAADDARVDETLLEHQAQRYRRRLTFWNARLTVPDPAGGDAHV
jgi:hypothetical protein